VNKHLEEFRRAGHGGTLIGALVYFTVSTAVWVMVGALGVYIAEDLKLAPTEKGLLIALPILCGSLLRIPVGILGDRVGAKKVGTIGRALTVVPLLVGWLGAASYVSLIVIGLMLSVAGASFALALPLASRCYPARHQGLVMGIVGSGNCGTVLAALLAPRLAEWLGWHGVFGLTILPLLFTLALFSVIAKEQSQPSVGQSVTSYSKILRQADSWWFSLFYMVTFGGFVGLASFLPVFFYDEYGVGKVMAGNLTALCVFGGSFLRPVGGLLADRHGGIRVLMALYGIVIAAMLLMSRLPPLPWAIAELFLVVSLLGVGNGAVFQLVPQRFQKEIGAVTGLVGAVGGVGGFLLSFGFGLSKELLGTYGIAFASFALAAASCVGLLAYLQADWRRQWAREEVGMSV
jgi:NNP family nitrate/nitrite transporter-like MFS transporter